MPQSIYVLLTCGFEYEFPQHWLCNPNSMSIRINVRIIVALEAIGSVLQLYFIAVELPHMKI